MSTRLEQPPTQRDATGTAAGDPLPDACAPIEVRVPELRNLCNPLDPSPFKDRDLDPSAEAFIVNWSKDLPRDAPLALVVHLDRSSDVAADAATLRDAVHGFFKEHASRERRRLRELFRRGRISLAIGLAFVAATIATMTFTEAWWPATGFARILHESLLIIGWVAMWRPLEIFLYDWWPIRSSARLFDRLATMPVRVTAKSA